MPSNNTRRFAPVTETVTRSNSTPTASRRLSTISSLPTTRERLLTLMSSGKWFDHVTIRNIVGSRYSRVMSELRKAGFSFKKKFTQTGRNRLFSYRLVSSGSRSTNS